MAYAGLVWLVAPRAVFPVVVYRPEMLCIMADMDQKDSLALFSGSGMCKVGFTGDSAPRAVFLSLLYETEGQLHGQKTVYFRICSSSWSSTFLS